MDREKLLKQALNSYNSFLAKEYGEENVELKTKDNFEGKIDILYSTFEVGGYSEEVPIQVYYDLDREEYEVEIQDDNFKEYPRFTEETTLEDFVENLKYCGFDEFYNYFVDQARKNFAYQTKDEWDEWDADLESEEEMEGD